MPKTMKKRVYTYGQLDTILHRRGKPDQWASLAAPLYGKVQLYAPPGKPYMAIRYASERLHYEIASVFSVAGGDTVYRVAGASDAVRKGPPAWRNLWRKHVAMFTPREVAGRIRKGDTTMWYRIRGGVITEIPPPTTRLPRNRSLLYPKSTRPSVHEWAGAVALDLPKFYRRAVRFAGDLKKSLADCLNAEMQLMRPLELDSRTGFYSCRLFLHVCLPPTEQSPSKRLAVGIGVHDLESRTHFHVDGDYGIKHSQFSARDADLRVHRWPCGKDAIIGIKEWVMDSIYIPGL